MNTQSKLLDYFERTSCDCSKCTAACRTMPGYLIPGDIERIAEYVGADPDDENFLIKNFRASEGPLVSRSGKLFRIPTIVPAQFDDNGRCVFMTRDGRCSVHKVSPFGCSRFNVCDEPTTDAEKRSTAGLLSIMRSWDYNLVWMFLFETGHRAPPLGERRGKLAGEILRIERETFGINV